MLGLRERKNRKGPSRYSSILEFVKKTTDADMLTSSLAFINALISAPDDLATRMKVRRELLVLKLEDIIKQIRDKNADKKGLKFKNVTTQLQVFAEEFRLDRKEENMHKRSLLGNF